MVQIKLNKMTGNANGSYNHGQTSWDTFTFLRLIPIHTGPTPPLNPQQCWTSVSRIFSEFQLCIGWGEGKLQENFNLSGNREMTETYQYCSTVTRTFVQDCSRSPPIYLFYCFNLLAEFDKLYP